MAEDILLNYAFKVKAQAPLPQAQAEFLRNALIVVKPKEGAATGIITQCNTPAQIAALTNNTEARQALAGGLSKVYILPTDTLDISDILAASGYGFYTVAVGSEFDADDWADKDFGDFECVIWRPFLVENEASAKNFAAVERQAAFLYGGLNGAGNMFFALGSFLSADPWDNRQYAQVPYDDGIKELGDADGYFDDRVSFALTSEQYGPRLAFLSAGGQAIIAPYIIKNLIIDLQGAAIQYLSLNRPQYTITQAKLLEDWLETSVIQRKYAALNLLDGGDVVITLANKNYQANGTIRVPQPTALWKITANLIQEII